MGRRGALQPILFPNLCECLLGTFTLQVLIQRETIASHNSENVKIPRQVGQSSEDKAGQQALEGSSTEHTEVGRGEAGAKGTKRHQTENQPRPQHKQQCFP